ncbi:hypothetical protein JQ604_40035 [Bradyrhizobium jicamae]|uniref:hypothetical protein n=1 Tax=Bradyrhizobium jicamae TaxID=280332 RepID=UPI001BABF1D0|nr:hypothetical protein [Bradyrhizobium jicamae]MBR0758406.1 hypothetical protein [Bradyrhizobium jicamae]
MWKRLWKTWTLDKPAAFGDLLWDVFVVQFAAWLDRLTWRKVIAFIPVVILILAYMHRIPIPPELMLVGDLLAYIDIFTVAILLGLFSRAATILFVIKQTAARTVALLTGARARLQRFGLRHRREGGAQQRRRSIGRTRRDDDESAVVGGFAWA